MSWKIYNRPGTKIKKWRHKRTFKKKSDARKYQKTGEPLRKVATRKRKK